MLWKLILINGRLHRLVVNGFQYSVRRQHLKVPDLLAKKETSEDRGLE